MKLLNKSRQLDDGPLAIFCNCNVRIHFNSQMKDYSILIICGKSIKRRGFVREGMEELLEPVEFYHKILKNLEKGKK